MRRWDFFVAALVVAAFVAFVCVSTGCAASRDPLMARVFEAPNVIHVCVRPPNVPKNQASWAVTASGGPLTAPSEVDIARRNGLAVYVFDPNAPPRSAKLLPIPHHRLECPAPPKPRVVVAKVKEGEEKKEESKRPEPSKPKPRPIAKRSEWCPEAGQARRGGTGSRTCTRVVVRARTEPVVVVESPREVEPSRRCQDPGQTRRRGGTGSRNCTKVLVEDRMEPVVVAANRPPPVEPPVPKDPSEVEPGDVWQYETWRQTPEETARLERAYECIKGFCHSRHKNFQPNGGKKPAGKHDGQSLSTGSGGGASAPKTTVRTRTRPFGKPKGAKPKGGAGSGGAASAPKTSGDSGAGPYSHLEDHSSVGPGKDYTKAQKRRFLSENEARNGGALKDDRTGEPLVRPQKHQKGVSPPENEAHVDHRQPRSKGGPNSAANAEVRSRLNNLQKGSKTDP
ncbi:hypothetical protein [Polyangium spumosum]|uniref:Uncharacterized protein n=1 Tax=Polyangium spumosum TaxID=889282 RepID=A0A6N7PRV8_9BACT|nr:hypothetical protein [Polyangium spumosum]MRG92965.1 hypothetical protein [Polyangium spumosum]